MTRRRFLETAIKFMVISGLLVFVFIFLRGLWPVEDGLVEASQQRYEAINPGETKLLRGNAGNVWVTRFDSRTLAAYEVLSQAVEPEPRQCGAQSALCIIPAATDRIGILLRHVTERPAQLDDEIPWQGGFINPATSAVYDLFGRCYVATPCGEMLEVKSI